MQMSSSIGGGLAGLVAARDLADAGRRVIVLEARDRLGGRTWTGDAARDRRRGRVRAARGSIPRASPRSPPRSSATASRMRTYREPGVGIFVSRRTSARTSLDGDAGLRAAFAAFDDAFAAIGRRLAARRPGLGARAAGRPRRLGHGLARGAVGPAGVARRAAGVRGGDGRRARRPSWRSSRSILDAIDNGYAIDAGWSEIGLSFVGGTRTLVDALAPRPRCPARARRRRASSSADDEVTVRLDGGGRLDRPGRRSSPCRSTSGATSRSTRR